MPRSKKIDLEKVLACMDTVCPKCGRRISPAELQRIDFTRVRCPACGEAFVAGKPSGVC
jgi:ribosomal protein S27AE